MKKYLYIILPLLLLALISQSAEAARWSYHFNWDDGDCPGGDLRVYGTIDCQIQEPPIFEGYAVYCQTYRGFVPGDPINDVIFEFDWDYWCNNKDRFKIALPGWDGDTWELLEIPSWVDANVTSELPIPSLGDTTGVIQEVYIVVDLAAWHADQRAFQASYTIVDGECDDLPGFLIGTTPIVFDSLAGETENPFSTTNLSGILWNDAEVILDPGNIPTLSEWGLIIFSLLILSLITVVVARRRTATSAAGVGSSVTISGPIFAPTRYLRMLIVTLSIAVVVLIAAMMISGSLPLRDIAGTILSAAIVAYIAHLWIVPKNKE